MKIVVKNADKQKYLTAEYGYCSSVDKAREFSSVKEAKQFCSEKKLREHKILLVSDRLVVSEMVLEEC